ncbi:DUF1574 domain-containing protein [Winogradskyella psychrotolerans]|uniref:DUF1574 domain-containing protein n=1 Tax=Winogradskyella psychrotolerans TaxID=1344585 RepID=UPI001C07D886|nr:DUF1574 domain-containing protein [Winogradskyella psychrotolerans]MBU2928369.1 DUF1574 domain-containing protein [Winogradskyella psychrotolerans]
MKKFLKQIVYGLFLFALINLIILAFYEYPAYKAIKNKTHKNYLKWTDIHTNKNKYDLIILGSSRMYTAFNPEIIDEGLNLNSYNMGTSAQDIAESYYSLKEILDYQRPKYVVLELYFETSDNSHDFYQIFSNASFFNSTKNKYDLVTDGYGQKGIVNYVLPLLKFNNYIKQDLISLVSNTKEKKKSEIWIKGYLYDTTTVTVKQIKSFEPIGNLETTTFNESRFKKYFYKIEKLAKAKNIKIIYIRTPYPPTRVAITSKTDERDYYDKFSKLKKITYYDLGYYKQYNYTDTDFTDYHHLNYKGAEKASKQLIETIKEN